MATGRGRRGFTLAELLVVLALVAVLASVAAPSLSALIARQRLRGALNQLTADLYYARLLAVENGRRVTLRFEPSRDCTPRRPRNRVVQGYRIVVRGTPERVARTVSLRWEGRRLCLETNNSDSIAFNSRGLLVPFANRTVWATHGSAADSLTLSVLGRVYRRF
ncbi:MAG TPA: GspH/FimT family pseudopilin [Longimicrobiaceae bacterium]|nr:GspH/FimT family pseudopilin [Longimicrobiaceae bacterium]